MKPQKWCEEFDKKYSREFRGIDRFCRLDFPERDKRSIKNFIQSLLSAQKEEKKGESWRRGYERGRSETKEEAYKQGFSDGLCSEDTMRDEQCIEDIKKAKTEMKEEIEKVIEENIKINQMTHRIGSHSDDYGGESDYPCNCDEEKRKHKIEELKFLKIKIQKIL